MWGVVVVCVECKKVDREGYPVPWRALGCLLAALCRTAEHVDGVAVKEHLRPLVLLSRPAELDLVVAALALALVLHESHMHPWNFLVMYNYLSNV